MSQPDIHALLECLQTSLQTMIQTHGKFLQSGHVVMLTLVHRPHLLLPVHFSILQAEKSRIRALEQGYRLTLNNLNWFLGGIIFKVKNSRSTINCFPKGTSRRLQSCNNKVTLFPSNCHCCKNKLYLPIYIWTFHPSKTKLFILFDALVVSCFW